MKKRLLFICLSLIMLLLLASCVLNPDSTGNDGKNQQGQETVSSAPIETSSTVEQSPVDIDALIKQLEGMYMPALLSGPDEKIVSFNVERYEMNETEDNAEFWVVAKTNDKKAEYEKKVFVSYYYNPMTEEWLLWDTRVGDSSEWIIRPLAGVSKDDIALSLRNSSITITANDEFWNFNDQTIKELNIEKQETDLNSQKDIVSVALTLDDKVMEASGVLDITYRFVNGEWSMSSLSGNDSFTSSVKPGLDLNVNEAMLLNLLDGEKFKFGAQNDEQDITILKNQVSEFTIVSSEAGEKNTQKEYNITCTLTKANAVFLLDVSAQYSYNDQWNLKPFSISAKCSSINITGTWSGRCEYHYNFSGYKGIGLLTINNENGVLSATYTCTPDKITSGDPIVSYKCFLETYPSMLRINMNAGGLLSESSGRWGQKDLSIKLLVDEGILEGTGDGGEFTLTQQ